MKNKLVSEKEIVAQILNGNEKALRFFYKSFQRPLYSFIKKKINEESDCEEIMQDTFLATLEALRDFSFRSSLFTFMCSIAIHKVIDFYRKKKIKNIVMSKLVNMEPLLTTLLNSKDIVGEELLKSKIKETFRRVSPKYCLILKLKYIYGYSVSEISQKLSISFKSAESMLFRARKAFVLAYSI